MLSFMLQLCFSLFVPEYAGPINYRPQMKFAKVMFSQVSVCPRRGGGCLPLVEGGSATHTPGQTPPQADTPSWADTPPGQTLPRRHTPVGRHHPPPSACWDTHPLPSACWDTPPGIRSTSGRYASHWNAFLFQFNLMPKSNLSILNTDHHSHQLKLHFDIGSKGSASMLV